MQTLATYVTGIGSGTSLADKVNTAINYYNAGQTANPCGTLTAVINAANAQNGKSLTQAQTNTVITDVNRIRAVIGG
jgi:hypothetical protein